MKYLPKDISKLGCILGIWAHPDDEVFTSGGLIASAIKNGQDIIIITATTGDAGHTSDESKWPKNNLSSIRKKELDESLAILGLNNHFWLDYRDGQLKSVDIQEAVTAVMDVVGARKIDTIVTFEENGITGHPDHRAVYKWGRELSKKLNSKLICACENQEFYETYGRKLDEKFDVYFNTIKPKLVFCDTADICLCLDDEISAKKFRAISAHASQTSTLLNDELGRNAVMSMCKNECFTNAN